MSRILLIDDDDQLRAMLQASLEVLGHEVEQAADGVEGMRRFRECSPDIVITDLIMPNKEGIELILELRRLQKDVKIVAMSGGGHMSTRSYLDMVRMIGVRRVLEKPFSLAQLKEVLDSFSSAG